MKQEINNSKSHTLKPEQKTVLLHSIANYLENTGGFSKTLKKLKSEAKLEVFKTNLLDLAWFIKLCKFSWRDKIIVYLFVFIQMFFVDLV